MWTMDCRQEQQAQQLHASRRRGQEQTTVLRKDSVISKNHRLARSAYETLHARSVGSRTGCAGIDRHVVGDERGQQEREHNAKTSPSPCCSWVLS